jgi:signal transduction histidine kinase
MSPPGGLAARLRRWVAAVLDLTERSEVEATLAASAGRERAAHAEAEAAHRARHDFVAHLSHELRAPLNAQLLWVRLLQSGTLDSAAAHRALDTIEENLRRQNRMIDDLVTGQRGPRQAGEPAASFPPQGPSDPRAGVPADRASGEAHTGG